MRYPSLIVVLAMLGALALFVWRARPANRLHRLFALQILSFSTWTLGVAGLYNGSDHFDIWGGLCFAGASLIPSAFLAFVHYYPPESRWPSRTVIRAAVLIGILFALMSVSTSWIVTDFEWRSGELWRRPGPLYGLFAVYFLAVWGQGAILIFVKWRRARGVEHLHLKYLT